MKSAKRLLISPDARACKSSFSLIVSMFSFEIPNAFAISEAANLSSIASGSLKRIPYVFPSPNNSGQRIISFDESV